MQQKLIRALCMVVVVLFVPVASGGQARPVTAGAPAAAQSATVPGRGEVVRIRFASDAQLARLTARLDIWEVHRDQRYVVAYVDSRAESWLIGQGFVIEPDLLLSYHPDTIPNYACYRSIAELYAQLSAWAAQYPDLVELHTIGQSFEGRPLYVLRLTNRQTGGLKPVFFLMANIHGRELVTPETAMAFVQSLLEGYGSDADATWLLDHQEAHVLVSANPDGHVRNEAGQPWAYWRKNAHPYNINACGSAAIGVDLNRNSSFRWGFDNIGSSADACDELYRGPAATSEPETRSVQAYVRSIFPDQRGPGEDDAAPSDTTGMFITLHSYGNDVLWPWGWTTGSTPNGAELQMLGRKMARYNGYTPAQADSYAMYPTNGSTDDWAYGELGVPAFTFEEGQAGGFYPACSVVPGIITPNVAALVYAFKVARTPYDTSAGPDAVKLAATSSTVKRGETAQLQATIEDASAGASDIVAAEAYVDTPPWTGGQPVALAPVDSSFDSPVEDVSGDIPTTDLAAGKHLVYVRGRNAREHWGPLAATWINVRPVGANIYLPALRQTPEK